MRKIILSAVAMFAFGFAGAQGVHFGVKAGANLSNLRTDYGAYGDAFDVSSYESKIGFNIGALVEYKFNDKMGLQAEVAFSQQGAKIDELDYNSNTNTEFTNTVKRNLSYVNIPIFFKFYPIHGLFVEAGPQLGILVSAKDKYETSIETTYNDATATYNTTDEEDIKDSLKSIDFGFNLGVGYEFTENFFVDARYYFGFSNIYDYKNVLSVDDEDYYDSSYFSDLSLKNSVFSVNLGYKF